MLLTRPSGGYAGGLQPAPSQPADQHRQPAAAIRGQVSPDRRLGHRGRRHGDVAATIEPTPAEPWGSPVASRSTASALQSFQRGWMENLIKAHKLHLASDRTSCTKAAANQFRLVLHTAAYWLLHELAWTDAQELVLAPSPVRHAPARVHQGSRPGHRAGEQDQAGAAFRLSLPRQPRAARGQGRQATLSPGAACPDRARQPQQPAPMIAPPAPRIATPDGHPARPHQTAR